MEQLPAGRKLVTRTVAITLRPAGGGVIPHMEEDSRERFEGESMPDGRRTWPDSYFLTYFWTRQFSVSATKISSRGDTAM